MAADSWEAKQREAYQADPAMWLQERHWGIVKAIDEHGEAQAWQTKASVQNAVDWLAEDLGTSLYQIMLWVGAIAIISLASAGLWIGVVGVVCVLIVLRWRRQEVRKTSFFRHYVRRRFRHIFDPFHDWPFSKLSEEDQMQVRKWADAFLFPTATNKRWSHEDLYDFGTLYEEARGSHDDWRPDDIKPPNPCKCEACTRAPQMKEHIESAVSKVETEVKSARQRLVAQIEGDGAAGAIQVRDLLSNTHGRELPFLEDFGTWEKWGVGRSPEDSEFVKSLCDKECWTFDDADKVREVCRGESRWHLASPYTASRFDHDGYTALVFDNLSRAMEAAAVAKGLQQDWEFYDRSKSWLASWNGSAIRRAINRRSSVAMFRELLHLGRSTVLRFSGGLHDLALLGEALQPFGVDGDMLASDARAVENFLWAEWQKKWKGLWKDARESVTVDPFPASISDVDHMGSNKRRKRRIGGLR